METVMIITLTQANHTPTPTHSSDYKDGTPVNSNIVLSNFGRLLLDEHSDLPHLLTLTQC